MTSSDHPSERSQFDALDQGAIGFSLDLPAGMFRTGDQAEPVILTMAKRVIGPVNREAKFTVVNDLALFEGDIVLGDTEEVRNPPGDRGLGLVGEQFRWPDGIVAFITEEKVRARVEAAIDHWEQRTPFRFVQRTDQADFISFRALGGCFSRVGRQGGEQVISLAAGAASARRSTRLVTRLACGTSRAAPTGTNSSRSSLRTLLRSTAITSISTFSTGTTSGRTTSVRSCTTQPRPSASAASRRSCPARK